MLPQASALTRGQPVVGCGCLEAPLIAVFMSDSAVAQVLYPDVLPTFLNMGPFMEGLGCSIGFGLLAVLQYSRNGHIKVMFSMF